MLKKYNVGEYKHQYNLKTPRGGYAKDQIVLCYENARVFKSYNSIIAIVHYDGVIIGRDFEYSKTTGTYRCQFLGENIAETRKNIKSGKYKYDEDLR